MLLPFALLMPMLMDRLSSIEGTESIKIDLERIDVDITGTIWLRSDGQTEAKEIQVTAKTDHGAGFVEFKAV